MLLPRDIARWIPTLIAACATAGLLSSCDCGSAEDPAAQGVGAASAGGAGDPGGGGGAGAQGGFGPGLPCSPDSLPGPIEAGRWDSRFTVAGVAGPDGDGPQVSDFARDLDGTVLATGRFRWLGSEPVEPLLRSEAGQQWAPARSVWELEPPEFGGFSAVAVGPAGELALATTGVAPQIWVDTGEGLQAIADLSDFSSFYQYVRSFAWYGGALWAAGSFTLKGTGISHLAVWDGAAWAGPPGGDADAAVYELMVSGDQLYAAGLFETLGGVPARRVAAWNGSAWSAFDMQWSQVGGVFGLAIGPSGNLVAGGTFSDIPAPECPSHGGVAEWNGTAWEMLGGGVSIPDVACGSTPGWVYDIAFHEGDLYVTGSFTHVGGPVTSPDAIPVASFARWVGGEWQSLDDSAPIGVHSPWIPIGTEGFGIAGQRLFSDGDRLLAGILVPGAGGVASPGLIAYQGGQWVAQGPEPGLGLLADNVQLAVGGPDCSLHALGNITHTRGLALASPVVRFDAGKWTAVGGAVPESLRCDGGIAVDPEGTTFVACVATEGDGSEVLAAEGDAWTSLGMPDAPGDVMALAVDAGGALWAVGGAVGGQGFVARYDDGAWTTLAEANGAVTHIDFAPDGGGELVVGGTFTQLGGSGHRHVARWDGEAWASLGEGLISAVSALESGRHGIYASEQSDGSPAATVVGRWDGAEWVELATAEHEFPTLILVSVDRIVEVGTTLVVAGSLYAGEFPPKERNALVFDGTRFSWLDGGIGAVLVHDAAVTSDGLWFGGAIAEAGIGDGRVSTVGIAHFGWRR